MLKYHRILLILLALLSNNIYAKCINNISGYYIANNYMDGRDALIKIFRHDGKYFGFIASFFDARGKTLDLQNPKLNIRDRDVEGSIYIYNLSKKNDNEYVDGRYYNFHTGKTFRLQMRLLCNELLLISSIDKVGLMSSKYIYKSVDKEDIKIYLNDQLKLDFGELDEPLMLEIKDIVE